MWLLMVLLWWAVVVFIVFGSRGSHGRIFENPPLNRGQAMPRVEEVLRLTSTGYSVGDGWRLGNEVFVGGPPWVGTIALSRDLRRLLGRRLRIAGWGTRSATLRTRSRSSHRRCRARGHSEGSEGPGQAQPRCQKGGRSLLNAVAGCGDGSQHRLRGLESGMPCGD